jgi:hypothetical protein
MKKHGREADTLTIRLQLPPLAKKNKINKINKKNTETLNWITSK